MGKRPRSVEHVWGEGPWGGSGYRHDFLSPEVMVWTCIAGEREGVSCHERYDLIDLGGAMQQLIFVERRTGLGKSLIYDFDRREVFGTLFPGDGTAFNLHGRITDATFDE